MPASIVTPKPRGRPPKKAKSTPAEKTLASAKKTPATAKKTPAIAKKTPATTKKRGAADTVQPDVEMVDVTGETPLDSILKTSGLSVMSTVPGAHTEPETDTAQETDSLQIMPAVQELSSTKNMPAVQDNALSVQETSEVPENTHDMTALQRMAGSSGPASTAQVASLFSSEVTPISTPTKIGRNLSVSQATPAPSVIQTTRKRKAVDAGSATPSTRCGSRGGGRSINRTGLSRFTTFWSRGCFCSS